MYFVFILYVLFLTVKWLSSKNFTFTPNLFSVWFNQLKYLFVLQQVASFEYLFRPWSGKQPVLRRKALLHGGSTVCAVWAQLNMTKVTRLLTEMHFTSSGVLPIALFSPWSRLGARSKSLNLANCRAAMGSAAAFSPPNCRLVPFVKPNGRSGEQFFPGGDVHHLRFRQNHFL